MTKPQDVYSDILHIVLLKIDNDASSVLDLEEDSKEEELQEGRYSKRELAQLLRGRITRKVIKQTVMTSVYGVTKIGARDQVRNRLMEVFFPEKESELIDLELERKVTTSNIPPICANLYQFIQSIRFFLTLVVTFKSGLPVCKLFSDAHT